MKKLPLAFYDREDVQQVARDLLGKIIVTHIDNVICSGIIVETEAYVAFTDKASHAYMGRRTARNEHMYSAPGTVYVYICYGMHNMLNVVTNKKNIPDAVLIRAIEPLEGSSAMLARTGKKLTDYSITKGPGNVGKALGILKLHSGLLLTGKVISIYENTSAIISPESIGVSKRIGVESAGRDSLLPYRFYLKGNKFVSARPVK
ncbi:MAG: DNA-3-methyladenine glycosylase [Bacteroidetes bacterium]|nr:DNA-3-methyladenine glycosylase [Bacteroidota bacterium]MBS1757016.1 DNA-3-methyladenine glycosylase [Bacteroidota bacterium]